MDTMESEIITFGSLSDLPAYRLSSSPFSHGDQDFTTVQRRTIPYEYYTECHTGSSTRSAPEVRGRAALRETRGFVAAICMKLASKTQVSLEDASEPFAQLQSPLFRLPAELRVHIYFMVLAAHPKPLIVDHTPAYHSAAPLDLVSVVCRPPSVGSAGYPRTITHRTATPLRKTCRRAHDELGAEVNFFFVGTEFGFTTFHKAEQYMARVPPQY